MAIIRLTADNFERLELLANPQRTFSSSSFGITGSVPLFPDLTKSRMTGSSSGIKDLEPTFGDAPSFITDNNLDLLRNACVVNAYGYTNTGPDDPQQTVEASTNIEGSMLKYLSLVNNVPTPVRSSKRQEVIRFTPGVKFEGNFFRKGVVKNILFPHYRMQYPTAQWSYTNYNCLNFVTGGNLPTDSVLIYPAGTGSVAKEDFNPLAPANGFTFDFYINPRYGSSTPGGDFKAGTILHMSSCYALSLVSGSAMHPDGGPDGYRLLLQLSASANILPSKCTIAGNTVTTVATDEDTGALFVSEDNSLKRNNWHHVSVRWGGPNVNKGTGSFVIDGDDINTFVINSSSIMQVSSSGTSLLDPDALFVGNFYEGNNYGTNAIALFFNPAAAQQEGVINFNDSYSQVDPGVFTFDHPLNAEVHDLKIFNRYKHDYEIESTAKVGSSLTNDLLFYVPPFFTKDSRERFILQTPFFDTKGSTEDPFNVALSFGIGGLEINLENFTKDLVTKQFPRLFNLTGSRINGTVSVPRTANYLLYDSGSLRKRNLTITPCDNGKFTPNFDLLKTEPQMGITGAVSGAQDTVLFSGPFNDRFRDDFGQLDFTMINLSDMVNTSSLAPGTLVTEDLSRDESGRFEKGPDLANIGGVLTELEAATPEDPGVSPGNILTVLQRTYDPSSSEVVFFDVSNIFYGDKIKPGTVIVEDLNVTGSGDRMTFKLRDDQRGNLYRADSATQHATWSSVGNVLYEEGIIVIKSPNMPFFGKDSFRVSFSGERYVYVLEMMIPAVTSQFNSSSNVSYTDLAPSDYISETAKRFTYLTGIHLHDNNLNVIGRANFAQPIIKRESDKIVIRLRMDF